MKMIKMCLVEKRFALLCEMGTGKTKVIIDTYGILRKYNKIDGKCLIICPKTIIDVWAEEIEKDSDLGSVIATGTKRKRIGLLTSCQSYAIINYEGVLSIGECSLWNDFDMIVLDESNAIKNHKAKRTKLILNIFTRNPYKYILSGTPITQNPIDIYCQYQFLSPSFLPFKNYYACRGRYCVMGGFQKYQIVGYKNLPELKAYIAQHSIQLKKEDCMDLPAKIYQKRIIEMSAEMKGQYSEMRNTLMLEFAEDKKITAPIALTKLLRLQQILSGQFLSDQKHNNKLSALKEFLIEAGDTPVVIWCRFRPSIKLLCDMCEEQDAPYSVIFGDIKDRAEEIRKFQEGETKRFIGQIQTGGLGITLTAGYIVAIYENTFSLTDRKQFEDRVHRPGQTHKCTYVDFVYKRTMDTKILGAIRKKQELSTYLVDSFLKGEY
jgi:SNF2 family DNA or RNA helicase